jgi:cobalt-zinc-cadmium efflux system membrane fusion protein
MKTILQLSMFFLLVACSKPASDESKTEETTTVSNSIQLSDAQIQAGGIKTAKATERNMAGIIRVNGKIDVPPQNLISVSVAMGGYLKSTKLLPGMHFAKGEVLAVLEDQQYIQLQQEFLTAKIKLQTGEQEYLRQKDLNESKAASDKVFQLAKADYLSTRVLVSALSEKLKLINVNPQTLTEENLSKNINIYAPFDGFVSKVNVNVGKYITPADVIFELVNPNDIHLNLRVFEKDLLQLAIGQKVLAFTNINPEKKYTCEILEISKDISDEHTAQVHSHFENYDQSLLPGMYMNAEVQVNNQKLQAMPESAVLNFDAKTYVFVQRAKNIYEMVEVQTGPTENNFTGIINGEVVSGKDVVVEGAYTLLMALKNKPEE